MRLYHGTNTRFAQLSLDFAARPGMSGNGHLGVWRANGRDLAENFGVHCIEVEADIGKAFALSISELSAMNSYGMPQRALLDEWSEGDALEREFYIAKRQELIARGYDFINLVESDGRSAMGIGLIPERLVIL